METPKIYVADLEAYNNGRLVGKWFDLSDYSDADELVEAIEEYMTSLGKEEYAIHDIENFPREMYSEYMGKNDFEQVYEIMDKANEMNLPLEVVSEIAREYSIDAVDGFQGKYDDMSDFAYELVEEMGIGSFYNPEQYLYVSDTDRRIIAGEEGDNYVNDIEDEDEGERIIEEADLDLDEFRQADEDTKAEMIEKAKDIVSSRIYDEWYDGLEDPYYFLVEEHGLYSADDLQNASFIQIDYDKLGEALEQDYNTVQYDGYVYVFNPNYAKGGFLSGIFGGGKKKYNRSWHQDHSQVNKDEKWERQDGMRHGKRATNRYAKGGQMSMFGEGGYAKGGRTTISDIKRMTEETSPHFFDRKTMKFFGQRMSDFKVRKMEDGRIEISAPMRDSSGKIVGQTKRFFNPETNKLELYAKGGKLKSYKYIPNRNIESVTLTQGEGTVTIPNDNILDGIYVRKRYKAFGRGGNTGNYNTGRSWHQDRNLFAKGQDYEVQYRKNKK